MINNNRYTIFPVAIGWTGLVSTADGIFASVLPHRTRADAETALLSRVPFRPQYSPEHFASLQQQIEAFFGGERTEFECKIDWSWATPFQQKVLQAVRSIPAGSVISYGEAAYLAGRPGGARAAGRALAGNMIPMIIPCHRVIRKGGKLGGFTGAGLDLKAHLLKLEGINIEFNS